MFNLASFLIMACITAGCGYVFVSRTKIPSEIKLGLVLPSGIALQGLISSYTYQWGISPRSSGFLQIFIALLGFFLLFKRKSLFAQKSSVVKIIKTFWLQGFVITVSSYFLLAPPILGGLKMQVFQGNQWDQITYLSSSQTYLLHPFRELTSTSISPILWLSDPVSGLGQMHLISHPGTQILFASLIAPFRLEIIRGSYSFILLLIVSLGASMFSLFASVRFAQGRNFSNKWLISFVSIFLIGFWGQYLIDFNAWSALCTTSMLVTSLSMIKCINADNFLAIAMRLSLLTIATVIIYPEATLLYSPLLVVQFLLILRSLPNRKKPIRQSAILGVGVVIAVAMCSYKPIQWIISLVKPSELPGGSWGMYFQAFLGGTEGWVATSVLNRIRTIPMGVMGLYSITPTNIRLPTVINRFTLIDLAIITVHFFCLVAVVGIVLIGVKRRLFSKIALEFFYVLLILGYLGLTTNTWVTGKALNYFIPVLGVVAYIVFEGIISGREKLFLKFLAIGFAVVWTSSQVTFGVHRIQDAKNKGIAHDWPYPAIQNPYLKTDQEWDLDVSKVEKSCVNVTIDVEDVFVSQYAQIRMNETGIPWRITQHVWTYFGRGDRGEMKQFSKIDCMVKNEGSPKRLVVYGGVAD